MRASVVARTCAVYGSHGLPRVTLTRVGDHSESELGDSGGRPEEEYLDHGSRAASTSREANVILRRRRTPGRSEPEAGR